MERSWDAIVLDEAQAIKNPASKTAKAAFRLKGAFRLAMTGTPVENRMEELWSQVHFSLPGLLGSRRSFMENYGAPMEAGDRETGERLRRKVRPFLLRRKKADVTPELPPRTENLLYCELSEEERKVYDGVLLATRKDVLAQLEAGGSVLAALEALLRLRQACSHLGLLPGQEAETSSKVSLLVDRLKMCGEGGHKSLVFSQWTSFLDRIEPHLKKQKYEYKT